MWGRKLSCIFDQSTSTKTRSNQVRALPPCCCASFVSLLHPESRRALANRRASFRNHSLLWSYNGRGRIRFLDSALRDCSRSSSQLVLHPSHLMRNTVICDTVAMLHPQDHLRSISVVCFSDDTHSVRTTWSNPIFNYIFRDHGYIVHTV